MTQQQIVERKELLRDQYLELKKKEVERYHENLLKIQEAIKELREQAFELDKDIKLSQQKIRDLRVESEIWK